MPVFVAAAVQYDGEKRHPVNTSDSSAALVAILRQLKKLGTNVNQVARQINERAKLSPYALSGSDLQPFVAFRQDLARIGQLVAQIKEVL